VNTSRDDAGTDAGSGDVDAGVLDAGSDAGSADNCEAPDAAVPPSSPDRIACQASYGVPLADGGTDPNPDIGVVLTACPQLAGALVWTDTADNSAAYPGWPAPMQQRLADFYGAILRGANLPSIDCPDPRGADAARFPTAAQIPHGTPSVAYFTTSQAADMYLASAAHALALEVRGDLPWSLLDFPAEELERLLSARGQVVPVSQPPRPSGVALPDAEYQVPPEHVNSLGFVCDPRNGYDFVRGRTSTSHQDLLGASPAETLANLTFFATQNSVHGFPLNVRESIDTWQFTLAERLHLGIDLTKNPPVVADTLVERMGCHSTAELIEELARAVNLPVLNVAATQSAWTDTTSYSYRENTHRALVFAWTRPAELRILLHADYANATALWPNFRASFGANDMAGIVWRCPSSYQAMGLQIDVSMPVIPVLSTNSEGNYETYFDFGRVVGVLQDEGRYFLRREACSWDMVFGYCVNPVGGPSAFAANNPYGGYAQFSDPTLLRQAYDRAAACVAALPAGCASIPPSYPEFSAIDWLP
jgi:hypothetical protein